MPAIEKLMLRSGSPLRVTYNQQHPNADNEIEIARGVTAAEEEIGISYRIEVNSEAIGLALSSGCKDVGDLISMIERIVMGLKAEAERIAET